jgi:hypothetical protein
MSPADFIRSALRREARLPQAARSSVMERRAARGGPLTELPGNHPLSTAIEAVACTRAQCANVSAVMLGSLIATLEGAHWSRALAGTAAAALAGLGVLLAFRIQHRHDCVIELILDGHEDVVLPIVQRERDRLLSVTTRAQLADTMAQVAREATSIPRRTVRLTPPLFAPRIVAPAADALREISALLEAGPTAARGVARTERLLGLATSPLYGGDTGVLRDELNAIHELLADHSASASAEGELDDAPPARLLRRQ